LTARLTISAASSTSTNSRRTFFPYENFRPTHQRDPIPRLCPGRGSVPLHCCNAFRLFHASPIHRVYRSKLGQAVATVYGGTQQPEKVSPSQGLRGRIVARTHLALFR